MGPSCARDERRIRVSDNADAPRAGRLAVAAMRVHRTVHASRTLSREGDMGPSTTHVPDTANIAGAAAHERVPLRAMPWAYSTYRGS